MEQLQPTLVFSSRWKWPRCWIDATLKLDSLEGTHPGTLSFWTEADEMQHAECEFPLIEPWDTPYSPEAQALGRAHSGAITSLGHAIGVLLGTSNNGANMYYRYGERGKWHPQMIDLRPTLWDWSGPIGVERPPDDLRDLLVTSLAVHDSEPLNMLFIAVGIGNPVARFLCTWQALALLLGSDSPKAVDAALSEHAGVELDCTGRHGRESKFAQYRHWLSHPKGRGTGSYAELDTRAREIADEFARAVLRIILAGHSDA